MSKFIDKARKMKKIINYDDVADQLEPSNIEFYIGEKLNVYGNYKIGDIVYVNKYKNENINKHLFVIVDEENRGVDIACFCMLISSKLDKLKYKSNILLKKDNKNNLKKDIIIKTDNIYKINQENIDFLIGKVDIELINKFRYNLIGI